MKNKKLDIALIGCGKMGSALLRGWLAAEIADNFYVLDPMGLPEEFETYTPEPISWFETPKDFTAYVRTADVFVIAVKPQIMDEVCSGIAKTVHADALVLSIAAGQTIASFKQRFGSERAIVRAMPNTPAAIGKAITVAATELLEPNKRITATKLLETIGRVEWVGTESLLDPVTALSGSGPAYVFLLIETLAKAGVKAGLTPDFAMKLARQTVIGSAALAEAAPNTPAATLRENVTSPGGTTAAALKVLMDGRMQSIFDEALVAATARSKELSQ